MFDVKIRYQLIRCSWVM